MCAGLLHWFTSPYVHRLAYDAATGVVEARTLTVLARPRVDCFPAVAVRHPQTLRPQATFEVSVCPCFEVDVDADAALSADLLWPCLWEFCSACGWWTRNCMHRKLATSVQHPGRTGCAASRSG